MLSTPTKSYVTSAFIRLFMSCVARGHNSQATDEPDEVKLNY